MLPSRENFVPTRRQTRILNFFCDCGDNITLGGFHLGRPQNVQIFLPPLLLVRKFMQPPLLRLLTMSAFVGTPPPPLSADVINGSPLHIYACPFSSGRRHIRRRRGIAYMRGMPDLEVGCMYTDYRIKRHRLHLYSVMLLVQAVTTKTIFADLSRMMLANSPGQNN